ncbi:MAG: hypothetical protein RLY47_118 [Candidatus Parcubacteria bacterium]|jgi:hypothetical protein
MERFSVTPEAQLRTPQEELTFLRERLKTLENDLIEKQESHEHVVHEVVKTYAQHEPNKVLAKGHEMLKTEVDAIVLDLVPEAHDAQMAELLAILQERGVKNALSVVEKLGDLHIQDDFHRFLAEYIKAGYRAQGIKEQGPLWKALTMTLFEVSLPFSDKDARERPLKEMLSSMEQLYAGLGSIASGSDPDVFTFEIAVSGTGEQATVYCAVPTAKRELFERQLLSVFPRAHLLETKNDYNIFSSKEGGTAASVAKFTRESAFPIKTYDQFDFDPMNITLSAFAKLAHTGEGAALQLIVRPVGDSYVKRYGKAIDKLRKGEKAKEVLADESIVKELAVGLKDFFITKKKDDKPQEKIVDERAVEAVTTKIAQPIVETNLRLVVSADTQARAEVILDNLEATFNQFELSTGNGFSFKRMKKGGLSGFVKNYTFRLFESGETLPMNLRELSTIFHLPSGNVDSSRELKRAKSMSVPAPVGLPTDGVLLGMNIHGNVQTPIHMTDGDRLRHFYCVGQTGVGKTTILKQMIIQDIKNGDGVCMIDPHGSDLMEVLANIPPERADDVIYFDPAYTDRPMGLNMLEYDVTKPEQKTFIVNELFSIFQKLYGANPESMGPMFEQYFRNSTMLVIEDPETGNTLSDVGRVMTDKAFRDLKLSRCKNPIVVQFWREVAEKAGGDAALANIVPYITSKFDVFLANDIMRPIITQKKSAFDFRDIMDNRKILLVNLSKGRLGEINASLIGLIIVGKILMAALSRVGMSSDDMHPFYLYIDEFQNISTDSVAQILSEARKYKLSLNMFHQYIKQLSDTIKDAVFGNVGTMCAYRVGFEDAEFLEKQFSPAVSAYDLMNVDNFNAFIKMLVRNKAERPFSIYVPKPDAGDPMMIEKLKELSYLKFGKPREEIEEELRKTYGM